MGNYNYHKPLTSQELRNIEHNRNRVRLEMQMMNMNSNIDTSAVDYMPMPTTPMTSQEVRTMVHNYNRLKSTREQMNLWNGNSNNNRQSNTNSNSNNDTSPVIGEIGALLLCLLAILPMILLHYHDQIVEFFYRFV